MNGWAFVVELGGMLLFGALIGLAILAGLLQVVQAITVGALS